jgi:Tfp pilus assembly protein PilN
MIRINLSPSIKRKVQQTRAITAVHMVVPTAKLSRGGIYAVVMLAGWIGIGVVALLLQRGVQDDTARLKAKAGALAADAKAINDKINNQDLEAQAHRVDELTAAIEALETKRRTPVYVYHELGNILTPGKGPDVDEAEQRKRAFLDPQARLDPDWDANAVWLKSMIEEDNNVLEITGGARDPDDLSEFVKRLRASDRFDRITHPRFAFEEVKQSTSTPKEPKPGESNRNHYSFQLTAQVKYWD